jgi:hypothetical protein
MSQEGRRYDKSLEMRRRRFGEGSEPWKMHLRNPGHGFMEADGSVGIGGTRPFESAAGIGTA